MQAEIQSQAKEEISRGHREHFLREQLRAIQSELGEVDPRFEEIDEYRAKIAPGGTRARGRDRGDAPAAAPRAHAPGRPRGAGRAQLPRVDDRAARGRTASPERLDLARRARDPRRATTRTSTSIKDRILECLGVRKLRRDSSGPILCFVGPPGVGKTSLGRSIARAMGREFVRVSLGGVRDEAEIRGHRRTYVGALPGPHHPGPASRPAPTTPSSCSTRSTSSAPTSAAIRRRRCSRCSTPSRTASFSDHYLNVPFDLSKVFFITTANLLDPIPRPLRDRMEVIRLPGYTPEEKVEIARSFLMPRQIEEHGLAADAHRLVARRR